MKFLIFTSSGGDTRFNYWTQTLHNSLRNIGNYDQDFLIFTDNPAFFDPLVGPKTMIHEVKLAKSHEYNHFRFEASNHIDLDKYDFIIYLDSDIVCVNDFTPILEFAEYELKGKIGYVRESIPQSSRYYRKVMELHKLQYLYENKKGINAGTFICDAGLFADYMQIWKESHKKSVKEKRSLLARNQGDFNYLIETEQFNALELPKYYVEFPLYYISKGHEDAFKLRINSRNILYHIVGVGNKKVHKFMKYYYRSKLIYKWNFCTLNQIEKNPE